MSNNIHADAITAQQVMTESSHLKIGDAAAANQHDLTPDFQFAGVQQKGTAGRLQGKKVLVYGGGDVWPKFIVAPLIHLGVRPQDITIIEKAETPIPEGFDWQYKGVNIVKSGGLAANPGLIKKGDFDFAVIASSPGSHAFCAKQAIEKYGLPVMIEKPMFSSTKEYDGFAEFCKEKGAHAYAIDWQRALSTLAYATLGQKVPFADSIEYKDGQGKKLGDSSLFQNELTNDKLVGVTAIFDEGRGNALADIRHRGHLLEQLREGGWASGGMLADMGIHPINAITGAGFKLDKITDAFFGGPSDENGYREKLPRDRNRGNEPEMFAAVDAKMSWNGQSDIPVHFECGKGSAPNVNDGRTIFTFASGKTLVQEFGHRVNNVTLYAPDKKTVLAAASDRGEPYERMFLEASALFDNWKTSAQGKDRIAYGAESREAIKVIEDSHNHACDHSSQHSKMRQIALDEMAIPKDVGDKAADFKVITLGEGQYKTISSEEVNKGSCLRHATAEGAIFDKKSGCFFYVDIEHGLLVRCNPNNDERATWKLTSGELAADGKPGQMLSVAAVNHDGSVLVMLGKGGKNAGLNYFNPETGELHNIGKIPGWEETHPDNRPNDATTLTIGGKNYLCYGTMSKHWNKKFDGDSKFERAGAYYLLDPQTLESHQITFEKGKYPDPLITNGLADGGTTADGKKILFWSETVEDAGRKGEQLNVYRGVLDPQTFKVSGIEIFKTHKELGGMMNGVETFGRPDGAQMAQYHDKEVYGISMLELGQIRFYYSNPKDPEYKKEALRIELPSGMTRNTRFALGHDDKGRAVGIVTTQDSGHFSRRWKVGERDKAKDGLNGSVISFSLPEGLKANDLSIERVDYPELEAARKLASPPSTISLAGARVTKIVPEITRAA